ncbi:MAG: hypothetical protein OEM41_06560 [Ignavibacteria bacterium]|nr:hypothetical protein [Ignavibacteria bacterium]
MVCNWNSSGLYVLVAVFVSAFSSCTESLPVREDPEGVLQPLIAFQEGIITVRGDVLLGHNGAFDARLRNTYAEVLEGESRIQGTLQVWLRDRPEKKATLSITPLDLQNLSILNGNTVTLRPGADARFYKQWSHKTDDGEWFWELVDTTGLATADSTPYADSDSVNVVAQVSLQLFEKVPARQSEPSEQTLLYRIF